LPMAKMTILRHALVARPLKTLGSHNKVIC
jgi:hypothetical protein